jgi:hypothetical protein
VKSGIIRDSKEEKIYNLPEHVFKNGAKYLGQWLEGGDEIRHG